MRVLISAPNLQQGRNVSGISTVVTNIIHNTKDVEFMHLKSGRSDSDTFGVYGYINLIWSLFTFPVRIKRQRIDLFHQNLPLNPKGIVREFLYNLLAYSCRLPVLVHVHGGEYLTRKPDNWILRKMADFILQHNRLIIVLSQIEQGFMRENYKVSSYALPNAVCTGLFRVKQKKIIPSVHQIIFIGRLHESKGVLDLVEVFRDIYPIKRFKFVLCGSGPQESFLVDALSKIMADDFLFMGVVDGSEKIRIIQDADFFILPSYGEGMPMALLETMSCGLIPLVTDDASMKVVVRHMENGIQLKKGDVDDIKLKLRIALDLSPEEFQQLSVNARATIEKSYTINNYTKELTKLYIKAIQ